MDKYNFENIHDWTYDEICSEAERLSKMELSIDKYSKLSALEKMSDLYCEVTKTKLMIFDDDPQNNYLEKYNLQAFFGNDDLRHNLLRLKILRGKIRSILMEDQIKFGYEIESEYKKNELMMKPAEKSRTKLMN